MTDYISRADAIKLVEKISDGYRYVEIPTKDLIRCIRSIPSADIWPELVRGEWILTEHTLHDGTTGYSIKCSVCREVFTEVDLHYLPMKTKYCPNCGADMRKIYETIRS